MTGFRWFLALLGLALAAADAPAQNVIVVNPYVSGTSLTYTRVGRHSAFSISAGAFNPYGFAYFGPVSRYSYYSSVTIYAPPVIVVPREPLFAPEDDYTPPPRRDLMMVPRRDGDLLPPDKPLPGRDAGNFRPLEPDNRNRAERPLPPPLPPAPPPPVKEPEPPPMDDKLPPLPHPPMPEANPAAESARLVGIGKTAFADQFYGLAAERFRQAARLAPNEALPRFLHAEALLALGKYLDAVDAINAGMALQPDWPTKRFQPLDLYGQHVAAYPEHLRRLDDTLAQHPNDATLLFLSGYQLWFDGRKDEARVRFQRARPGVADPAVVDRFLQVKPAPVAVGDAPRNWL